MNENLIAALADSSERVEIRDAEPDTGRAAVDSNALFIDNLPIPVENRIGEEGAAGKPCGAEANAAKFPAADTTFEACDRAVRTHRGMGYADEYGVERYFREAMATRIAPVSRELILCCLAERVLRLPKSH